MAVTEFPRQAPEIYVSKRQLAEHPKVRRSTRWVEQQVKRGLPSEFDEDANRRRFFLPTALAWLREHHPGLAEQAARKAAHLGFRKPSDEPEPAAPRACRAPDEPSSTATVKSKTRARPKATARKPPAGIQIRTAAAMLGVSPNTLRSWERRYDHPKPQRPNGCHRRYDLSELQALRGALDEMAGDFSAGLELLRQKRSADRRGSATDQEVAALKQKLEELEERLRELEQAPPPAA